MYKNYFILNRFAIELNESLCKSILVDAFSQDKDKLILTFEKPDQNISLEISTNPGFPYLNLRKNIFKAKKNCINFFGEQLPAKVSSISIAYDDRIIRFTTSNCNLFFLIRGADTNVCCLDHNNNLSAFKKIEPETQEKLKNELIPKIFITEENLMEQISFGSITGVLELRQQFPIFSKEIISEFDYRNYEFNRSNIREILSEIFHSQPSVFIDENEGSIHLGIKSFNVFPFTQISFFDSLVEAFNSFISNKYFIESKSSFQKIIVKQVDRELLRLSQKLNQLQKLLESESKENEYNRIANLILINLQNIKHVKNEIVLADIFNEDKGIKIKLDPKLSLQKNADRYFHKSKSEKINREKSKLLLKQCNDEFHKFQLIKKRANESDSVDELKKIMKELHIKDSQHTDQKIDELKTKFKHYLIENKYNVYVGKDSENNDLLTTRFAKQNDYWLHARSVSGSHVVLRVENSKEPIPKNVLKIAAALAAYHSKAKTSALAPVSFTLKKYVVKKKGFPAGTVHLLKEEVLHVKPEIPNDALFIERE